MSNPLVWKTLALALFLFGVACIPNLLRAAAYPFWAEVEAKVTSAMTLGAVGWNIQESRTIDKRYRAVEIEYAFNHQQYRTRLPNGGGFRNVSANDRIVIRVCQVWPSLVWADPQQGKQNGFNWLIYMAGVLINSASVFGPIALAVMIWKMKS